jgi:hypothetical protein
MTVQLVSRGAVAIALLMLTASNWPKEVRAQGANELDSLLSQVNQLEGSGKYSEAIPLAERSVALARNKYGDNHGEYASVKITTKSCSFSRT